MKLQWKRSAVYQLESAYPEEECKGSDLYSHKELWGCVERDAKTVVCSVKIIVYLFIKDQLNWYFYHRKKKNQLIDQNVYFFVSLRSHQEASTWAYLFREAGAFILLWRGEKHSKVEFSRAGGEHDSCGDGIWTLFEKKKIVLGPWSGRLFPSDLT